VSIVRAPLVYGRGVRANLRALVRLCDTGWPLPFGALANRRSFIEVNDLARLLLASAHGARAEVRTFMASHPEPVTPSQLVAQIRRALGRPPRLWSVPAKLLEVPASLLGRGDTMRKLTRPLEVDARDTEAALGWHAQLTLAQAVDDMVAGYREEAAA
jgi:nucleoside-diphosphate-sugar epimerase